MSPIENIWYALEEKYLRYNPTPITRNKKIAALKSIWRHQIAQDYINKLIVGKHNVRKQQWDQRAMIHRWRDLYRAKGQPTGF